MRAIVGWIFRFTLLVLFTCRCSLHQANGLAAAADNTTTSTTTTSVVEEMVPLVEAGKVEMMMVNGSRRKLGSFQICALCTCCGGGGKSYCLASPCCYAINCNIPNRPFGFCSFTPKTCNCFGCHL